MKLSANVVLTHSKIEQAIGKFQSQGGFIQHLPEQKIAPLDPVGSRTQAYLGSFGFGAGPEMRFEQR